jgi:hypothetical protein
VANHTKLHPIGQNDLCAAVWEEPTAGPRHPDASRYSGAVMAQMVKRIDEQRHELKALRYLLHFSPESLAKTQPLPRREDFQFDRYPR